MPIRSGPVCGFVGRLLRERSGRRWRLTLSGGGARRRLAGDQGWWCRIHQGRGVATLQFSARPEVEPEMIREVFMEVVTLLHDGLVLDDLDTHDANAVVTGLCEDLVTGDPGAAIRARTADVPDAELHDRDAVAWVYGRCLSLMQL